MGWASKLDELWVSHTGETVDLSLNQILPGLPSPDHGGIVDILAVLLEPLAEEVRHPEKLLIEEPHGLPPRPRVRSGRKL